MYQGVLRDDVRRAEKMRQRQDDFNESKRKRELYEQVQKVGGLDGGRGGRVITLGWAVGVEIFLAGWWCVL